MMELVDRMAHIISFRMKESCRRECQYCWNCHRLSLSAWPFQISQIIWRDRCRCCSRDRGHGSLQLVSR